MRERLVRQIDIYKFQSDTCKVIKQVVCVVSVCHLTRHNQLVECVGAQASHVAFQPIEVAAIDGNWGDRGRELSVHEAVCSLKVPAVSAPEDRVEEPGLPGTLPHPGRLHFHCVLLAGFYVCGRLLLLHVGVGRCRCDFMMMLFACLVECQKTYEGYRTLDYLGASLLQYIVMTL